jgi:integrase
LRVAVDLRVIREMPFRKVGLFKVDDSEIPEFYPVDELARLIAAGDNGPRGKGIVLLGADAVLRSGEMRALGKDSISWDANRLRIERQVWRDKMGTPKSGKGRLVPMTPRLRSALAHLIKKDQEFVLRNDDGGILSPKRMRSLVKELQRAAGVKVTGNCTSSGTRSAPTSQCEECTRGSSSSLRGTAT